MADRVELRIIEVDKELDRFPEPPKEPSYVVMRLIEQVSMCLMKHINADLEDNLFRMKFDRHLKSFGHELQASRLKVSMTNQQNRNVVPGVQDDLAASTSTVAETSGPQNKYIDEPIARTFQSKALVTVMDLRLEQLAIRYERGATNSIPGSINDKLTEQIIRESCSKWKDIVTKLLKNISRLIREIISASVKEKLHEWQHAELFTTMKQVLSTYVLKTMECEGERIYGLLDCVQRKPTIANSNYELKRRECLERLVMECYPRTLCEVEDYASPQWVDAKLTSDDHGKVIECVATIYTYHDILSDSFAGMTSTLLKAGVLAALVDEAPAALRAELKVLDTEYCAKLLAGDSEHEAEHNALLAEKKNLKEAMIVVENLQDAE